MTPPINIAVFTPTGDLAPNTRYIATVVTGIKDLAGNPLTTDFAWDFVTGGTPDSTAPAVTSTSADRRGDQSEDQRHLQRGNEFFDADTGKFYGDRSRRHGGFRCGDLS